MRRTQQLIVALTLLLAAPADAQMPAPSNDEEEPPPPPAPGDAKAGAFYARGLELVRYRKYADAIAKLDEGVTFCRQNACSPGARMRVYLALGIAFGLDGQADEAQTRFEWALALSENARPDDRYMTRDVRAMFQAAKDEVAEGGGAAPPGPVGVLTDEQKQAISTARQQLDGGDWEGCLQTMIVSTSIADHAAGRLMLAQCQDRGGLLLEAARDAEKARELAAADGDDELVAEIDAYLQELEIETPKIRLKIQSGIGSLVVKIDSTEIPADEVTEAIPHNPGTAVVEVTGTRGGQPFDFRQDIKFQRKELIELEVRSDVTPFQACLAKARTLAEREACEAQFNPKEGLTVIGALEVASYNDTNHVDIFSPSLTVAAEDPTAGWDVTASALVDVVSAASPDVVAMASRRFDDQRVQAGIDGGYKVDPVIPRLNASFSVERDYTSLNLGGSLTAEVMDKMLTPYVGYTYGYDQIGLAGTAFEDYRQQFFRHTINAGTSFVFSPSTLGAIAATVNIEDGDQRKPYRYVNLVRPELVDDIPRGASPELMAEGRARGNGAFIDENLPKNRQRYALLFRIAHRLETVTLRGSERVYLDSWSQWGSTTDARVYWDFFTAEENGKPVGYPQLTLGPHARFHIQGAASFFRRVYAGIPLGPEAWSYPTYRTGDRELGPLFSVTAGLGLRAALLSNVALSFQAEGIYTQFLDHVYLFENWGLFTASTLEVAFE